MLRFNGNLKNFCRQTIVYGPVFLLGVFSASILVMVLFLTSNKAVSIFLSNQFRYDYYQLWDNQIAKSPFYVDWGGVELDSDSFRFQYYIRKSRPSFLYSYFGINFQPYRWSSFLSLSPKVKFAGYEQYYLKQSIDSFFVDPEFDLQSRPIEKVKEKWRALKKIDVFFGTIQLRNIWIDIVQAGWDFRIKEVLVKNLFIKKGQIFFDSLTMHGPDFELQASRPYERGKSQPGNLQLHLKPVRGGALKQGMTLTGNFTSNLNNLRFNLVGLEGRISIKSDEQGQHRLIFKDFPMEDYFPGAGLNKILAAEFVFGREYDFESERWMMDSAKVLVKGDTFEITPTVFTIKTTQDGSDPQHLVSSYQARLSGKTQDRSKVLDWIWESVYFPNKEIVAWKLVGSAKTEIKVNVSTN